MNTNGVCVIPSVREIWEKIFHCFLMDWLELEHRTLSFSPPPQIFDVEHNPILSHVSPNLWVFSVTMAIGLCDGRVT